MEIVENILGTQHDLCELVSEMYDTINRHVGVNIRNGPGLGNWPEERNWDEANLSGPTKKYYEGKIFLYGGVQILPVMGMSFIFE